MTYYLAIDIGASGGRHILGSFENGTLTTEEIYRFENGIKKTEAGLVWNTEHLFNEVLNGCRRAGELGKIPTSIAIDTWGVDYCLLDQDKKPLYPVHAYRDEARQAVISEVHAILPHTALYEKTGIQFQPFNTVYQLYADKKSGKLNRAAYFLQIPDFLAFLMTGKIVNEYTNATTTSLINCRTNTWDEEILKALGIPEAIFQKLTLPGEVIGSFLPEVEKAVGYSATVLTCPTHDTASAYLATVGRNDAVTISSGTWSLIGCEQKIPFTSNAAKTANFTNEGGIAYRYRFLKNIMGMWLIQNIRRENGKQHSYNDLMVLAESSDYTKTFDVNHPSLSAPRSMTKAILDLLGENSLPLGNLLASIYHSLALSYKIAVKELSDITGSQFKFLQIVGGGSQDALLNCLSSKATGLTLIKGPTEATAIGNLASQIMKHQHLSLDEMREIIKTQYAAQDRKDLS